MKYTLHKHEKLSDNFHHINVLFIIMDILTVQPKLAFVCNVMLLQCTRRNQLQC
jgi:hypothetical protein